jgi:hypothetical protein
MGDLRDERPACEQTATPFPSQDEIQAFVEQHIPAAVLEVFPDWQGFLMKSSNPKAAVWIVRTRNDGEYLHHLTGKPALLLTDVLAQKGRSFAEARKTLLTQIIRAPLRFSVGEGREEQAEETHGDPATKDNADQDPVSSGTESPASRIICGQHRTGCAD